MYRDGCICYKRFEPKEKKESCVVINIICQEKCQEKPPMPKDDKEWQPGSIDMQPDREFPEKGSGNCVTVNIICSDCKLDKTDPREA